MSTNYQLKYYQENKEKKLKKDSKIFLKKKKRKATIWSQTLQNSAQVCCV